MAILPNLGNCDAFLGIESLSIVSSTDTASRAVSPIVIRSVRSRRALDGENRPIIAVM
jgi:hypothetical protein